MKLMTILRRASVICLTVFATCCGGTSPELAEEAQTKVQETEASPEDLWTIGVAELGWHPEQMPEEATAEEILSWLKEDDRIKDYWDQVGYGGPANREAIGYSR